MFVKVSVSKDFKTALTTDDKLIPVSGSLLNACDFMKSYKKLNRA